MLLEKFDNSLEPVSFFVKEIKECLLRDPRAAVSDELADQLMIYCALAEGKSTLVVTERLPENKTLHLDTQIALLKQFLPDLKVTKTMLEEDLFTLEIEGVGFCNE